MKGKGRLIINVDGNRDSLMYQCSLCGQEFRMAEDRSAKEATSELLVVFRKHIRERHPEDFTGSKVAK